MGQSEEAWNEVGEHFKSLGSIFKVHYLAQGEGDPMELVADDEVKEALRTLGVSLKAAFATVGETIADPEIRDEARQTASSFFDALGATFSDLGQDISKRGESDDLSSPPPSEEIASPDSSGVEE
jgi:uncharacterized protein with GYD domain